MNTCGICLDTLDSTQCQITTKCQHSFHNNCLTHWLLTNHTCPLCRAEIYNNPNDSSDFEDDEDLETEYFIKFHNSIITLDDSLITKITQRIVELTDHLNEDINIPLTNNWYIENIFDTEIFYTIVNTKKYKCTTSFQIQKWRNEIYIFVSCKSIYKYSDRKIRILRYGYEKWRTDRNNIIEYNTIY